MEVHYRHVPSLEKNYAVSAVFRGDAGSAEEIVRRLEESQEKRRTTQPAAKSAGCIFKNPDSMSGGKIGRRTGLEKFARRQSARLGGARQFYRQRWRRDRGRDAGVDRENPGRPRGRSAGSNWKPKCKSWGKHGDESALREKDCGLDGRARLGARCLARDRRGVAKALRSLGAEVTEVDVRDENFELPDDIELAFIALHGTFGEDGQVQQILEDRGVPYTGEGVKESRTRLRQDSLEGEVRRSTVSRRRTGRSFGAGQRPTIPLPFVIKAPRQGSTVGVYIVKNDREIDAALAEAREIRSANFWSRNSFPDAS